MGAMFFTEEVFGDSAREAFYERKDELYEENCNRDGEYEYYNGTMASTSLAKKSPRLELNEKDFGSYGEVIEKAYDFVYDEEDEDYDKGDTYFVQINLKDKKKHGAECLFIFYGWAPS